MRVAGAVPSGARVDVYWPTLVREENRHYQAGLMDAPDLWLWDIVASPNAKSYGFTLQGLAAAAPGAHVRALLQGASDFAAAPDHHVEVLVNGALLGDARWDGKAARTIEGDLPAGVLVDGANTLTVRNVGDTGASSSMVFLNRFEVRYPRPPVAEGGALHGAFEQSGQVEIGGLGAGARVVDVTGTPVWRLGAVAGSSGLRFRVERGRSYLATSALKTPVVKRLSPRLSSSSNGADWVVVGPREMLPAAAPLEALRRQQGLRTKLVALEDVFAEFGHGERSAAAIRRFVEQAYQTWRAPSPRYLVLLGDASYDPKDFLRTGVRDHVPTPLLATSFVWTASDPVLASVNGEDLLPDLAVGRLPAASVAEAERLVGKVVAFETAGLDLSGRAVLVSDNPDAGGDFEADLDQAAATVLSGREVRKVYLSSVGAGGMRPEIAAALDGGPGILSYAGHGGSTVWASENVWNNLDLAGLSGQAKQPLVITLNCLNGFFHLPSLDSLGEAFLKADGKGAIAVIAPSGFSLNAGARAYHLALLGEVESGRHARLGDALLAAQAAYIDGGNAPEAVAIYHLFGDPALGLRP
jgi:hypothetical protein